ncbi:acylneuraminate cytidylyltransferase family protein [Mucilaginibacter sp. BJC16-A38]|uniref:acylneuraminate cytidylyltransferase family protein n=1 Tax=Mucilaginibacter phenanthrenivorans TaxID=1234842 RepID=UPI002157DF68|nr:acylneuraminate cytidylyltransferase family protein [Mucilaginibacter phenanthrenivorans]MCR8559731.1 acylneuraminate cytidylyltransferase family protein [Mucilaginibacter phenanthrenivorans]
MEIPKITALVPMKGHSERVPHKNIRPLVGKPAFHWIMETLSKSAYINEILVNTDSPEIAESAKANFDKVKILERPDFLLGDMVSIQPLIAYDIEQTDAEYFLQTHSTNPLLTVESVDHAIEAFFAQKEHDALFSVTEVKQRFYWPDGRGINHDPKFLIRTQDLEPIYHENSCFYIFSKETNHKIKSRLGSNPMMFPIERLEAADIDDLEDFYWTEFLLQRRIANSL